jgi:predicted PhzF superfamily epimerase YddE/YHI9
MRIPIYQVDAFTDRLFGGNPAAVCPLEALQASPRCGRLRCRNRGARVCISGQAVTYLEGTIVL